MISKNLARLGCVSFCLLGLTIAGAAQAKIVSHSKELKSQTMSTVVSKASSELSSAGHQAGAGVDLSRAGSNKGLSTHGLHCAFFPVINRWICEPMNY
jgi:hypothetical protein